MFKNLILLLCVMCLFTLVACKQDAAKQDQSGSITTNQETITSDVIETEKGQEINSGIQLEDDVFEYNDSSQEEAKDNSSKSENSKDNTPSNEGEVDEEGQPSKNDKETNTSSDSSSETDSEDITIEDGVIKLPKDKLN